ncbi:hypothetical protein EVG20_g10743 [Dentipellis fragilis]|uniref:Uncharacterized protein n=1 Tax=Dentipellis fragilis TaxID=205917 RepID=A0A4Y9XQF2_9AGAM|nr:hypothetical protein EVG20_g10743 [Dentipellis fragilis]
MRPQACHPPDGGRGPRLASDADITTLAPVLCIMLELHVPADHWQHVSQPTTQVPMNPRLPKRRGPPAASRRLGFCSDADGGVRRSCALGPAGPLLALPSERSLRLWALRGSPRRSAAGNANVMRTAAMQAARTSTTYPCGGLRLRFEDDVGGPVLRFVTVVVRACDYFARRDSRQGTLHLASGQLAISLLQRPRGSRASWIPSSMSLRSVVLPGAMCLRWVGPAVGGNGGCHWGARRAGSIIIPYHLASTSRRRPASSPASTRFAILASTSRHRPPPTAHACVYFARHASPCFTGQSTSADMHVYGHMHVCGCGAGPRATMQNQPSAGQSRRGSHVIYVSASAYLLTYLAALAGNARV